MPEEAGRVEADRVEEGRIRVRLVTPDRVLVDDIVDSVEICGASGYIEVLYGHTPLLSELGVGHVRLRKGSSEDQDYFVTWGFCEVLPDRVTIMASGAYLPETISEADAERELELGRRMWAEAGDSVERYDRANAVMREADARLDTSHGSKY